MPATKRVLVSTTAAQWLRTQTRTWQLPPPSREPDLTLKIRPSDLRAIVAGKAGPRRLALRGRLRVLGDLKLGMRLSELFDLG
jgi:putative sterol carrier protein